MIPRSTAVTVAVAACCGSLLACSTPTAVRPHVSRLNAEQLGIETICLAEVASRVPLVDAEEKVEAFEAQLREALERRGFRAPGSKRTREMLEAFLTEQGGVYDPHTGQRHEERYARLRPAGLRHLSAELGCDAFLEATVNEVSAPWRGSVAYWDGYEYRFPAAIRIARNAYGWVDVLSLWIRLYDLDDEELYFGTGGIQVKGELHGNGFKGEFVAVDPAEFLARELVNSRAIERSLGPLQRNGGSAAP